MNPSSKNISARPLRARCLTWTVSHHAASANFLAALLTIALTPDWRLEAAIYDPDIPPALRTVTCTNQSAFTNALANAIPGDHLILANGTYTFGTLTETGTAANPIVIEAATNGMAIINCTAWQKIYHSSYVILKGLKFTASSGSQSFTVVDSNNVRITRCSFDGSGFGLGVAVINNEASSATASHHNRFDHCRIHGKTTTGEYLKYSDSGSGKISLADRIDHNFFDGRSRATGNGSESTRMGVGTISLEPSYMVCEYNLYKDCDGDAEVVSVKSSCATVRSNTFIKCHGTGVSLRQGTNNEVYNNIVLSGSEADNGGIKITGFYHRVHDNYIEGVTGDQGGGALVLQGGDINSVDSTGGHGVINALTCTNNILYNNAYGLEVGCKYGPYLPVNCTIVNNRVQQAVNKCYNITGEGAGNLWSGNTARLTGSATAGSTNGVGVTTTDIDCAAYRAQALTENDVGPFSGDRAAVPTPIFSGLTASQSITYGTGSITLAGILSGSNGGTPVYPNNGETVSATINGHNNSGAVTNTTGGFSITVNDATLATNGVSGSPYTIAYAYAGNGSTLTAAANDTSTVLTVNRAGLTVSGITADNKTYDGTTTATINTGRAALMGDLDGGNVVLSTAGATGAFFTASVDNGKTVQIFGLTISGSATSNYTLIQPTTTANISAVSPATISIPTSGEVNITFFGIPSSNYVVQTTTNLGEPWWPLSTNIALSDGSWLFTDFQATNFAHRFYRLAP